MIRRAERADVDRLVEMGVRFLRETEYAAHVVGDPEQMALTVRWLLLDGAIFVAERDGQIIGMVGVLPIVDHPLSGERVASEMFWWVEPEARGGSAGLRLLHEAEAWAKAAGARTMVMVAPNVRTEQAYRALGYTQLEVAYQRSL